MRLASARGGAAQGDRGCVVAPMRAQPLPPFVVLGALPGRPFAYPLLIPPVPVLAA